jgi:RNA polymerase sigma factor (sigma-70 family)
MSKPPPGRHPAPRGDPPASTASLQVFRAVCEAHLDFVWRFAAYRGVPADALEHVVHKVFGVLHGRLISLEHPEELRVAVAGITRNVVRAYLRQLADHSPLEPVPGAPTTVVLDFSHVPNIEQKSASERCDLILGKMTETEREVFILCEIEGLSLFETAEALHIGESTLRSRLDDARKIFNVASAELRAQIFWTSRAPGTKP